jgi:hypothetical protein
MTEIRMVVLGGMRWGVFGGSAVSTKLLKPAFGQLGHVVVDAPSRNGDDFSPYDEMLARTTSTRLQPAAQPPTRNMEPSPSMPASTSCARSR